MQQYGLRNAARPCSLTEDSIQIISAWIKSLYYI